MLTGGDSAGVRSINFVIFRIDISEMKPELKFLYAAFDVLKQGTAIDVNDKGSPMHVEKCFA